MYGLHLAFFFIWVGIKFAPFYWFLFLVVVSFSGNLIQFFGEGKVSDSAIIELFDS